MRGFRKIRYVKKEELIELLKAMELTLTQTLNPTNLTLNTNQYYMYHMVKHSIQYFLYFD